MTRVSVSLANGQTLAVIVEIKNGQEFVSLSVLSANLLCEAPLYEGTPVPNLETAPTSCLRN